MATKQCLTCKVEKPLNGFYNNRTKPDGHDPYCKPCHIRTTQMRRKANPERYSIIQRKSHLKYRYKLSPEQWQEMYEAQSGRCKFCFREGDLHVDHDRSCCPGERSCGECVRWLLCGNCNRGIGFFGDDPKRLERAAQMLREYRG